MVEFRMLILVSEPFEFVTTIVVATAVCDDENNIEDDNDYY